MYKGDNESMTQQQSVPLAHILHGNKSQIEAIKELEQLFTLDKSTLFQVIESFQKELNAGLANDRSSDLNMIPSFVTGYPTGGERGTYLALEVAGMDIYACQVKLKGDNGKLAINQYQYKIPQDLSSGDDFIVLINYVIECISDFLLRVGVQDDFIYPMAVSFGWAIKQTAINAGRIISLGYGLSYPNGVGVDIVKLMHEQLNLKGLPVKIVAITNDAVCTLLAHAYQHPTTRLGVVLSLGTNCAYYERTRSILKLKMESGSTQDDESMIVNTEWCNFGSSRRTLPCTWFDRKLVRESINPQFHVFEKMTTGIFLGEVVRTVLIYLVDREILFDGESSETLNSTYSFDTSYMYVCEADDSDTLEDTRIVIEDMLDISKTSLADREIVKKVCELVGVRAATLVGASLAAIVEHMVSRGIGMSEEGYSISISGGIYEDYPSFHPRVCTIIKELLPDDIAGRLSVGVVKHSRIVGAAIVAMMAEKNDTSY